MDIESAWMAGLLEGLGTFVVNSSGAPQLVIKTRRNEEALRQMAFRAGVNVREIKEGGLSLSVSGRPLHQLMKRLWPYLSAHRKREYKKVWSSK